MDGTGAFWPAEKVRSFQCTHMKPDEGRFMVTLRVDGKSRLAIEMNFHFAGIDAISYQTTYGSKNDTTYSPPPEVARFLEEKFSSLLFFNGELANELISGEGAINASQIIDTFYGLYQLEEMKKEASDLYEDHVSSKKVVKESAVQRLRANLKSWRKEKGKLSMSLEADKDKLSKLSQSILSLEKETHEHIAKNEKFQEEEQKASKERAVAEQAIELGIERIENGFVDPTYLNAKVVGDLKRLSENLETLKLPEPTSRAFFDELVGEEVCICGRPMDESARQSVREKRGGLLGDSITGFWNVFKDAVYAMDGESKEDRFHNHLEELKAAQDRLDTAETKLDLILHKAEKSGDAALAGKSEELKKLRGEKPGLVNAIAAYERPTRAGDDATTTCINFFERKIVDGSKKLASLSGSLDLKLRTEQLTSLLDEAYQEVHGDLKRSVVEKANEQLREILKRNPVQIEDISKTVKLKEREQGSVGQNLSVGYVFLAGIFHGGQNQFPFVVDSPAGALDDRVRKEVGGLLPKLIDQLVTFVIPPEREWFVEPLEEAAGGDVKYLTHLRLNDDVMSIFQFSEGETVSESHNGVVISGREAFFALGEGDEIEQENN